MNLKLNKKENVMKTNGNIKIAKSWAVKINGENRSIQLYDENKNELDGNNAKWEGTFWCENNQLTSLAGAPKEGKDMSPAFNAAGYLFADNILSRIVNKRKSGQCVIYKTTPIGRSKNIIYVARRGDTFSHGETVKKAIHDLRYKMSSRDTSQYKGWTLDSVHPIADVIGAYRAITGACETGTKQFCEGKKLPVKLSIKEAIELTKGAYASEKFTGFFTEAK